MESIKIIKATFDELKKDDFKQSVNFVLDEYIKTTAKLKESSCINKKISDYITEKKLQEGR